MLHFGSQLAYHALLLNSAQCIEDVTEAGWVHVTHSVRPTMQSVMSCRSHSSQAAHGINKCAESS